MLKRVVSIFLTLIMVFGCLPSSAGFAAAASDFTIRVIDGENCAVTGYTGSDTAVIIPDEIEGYRVQGIDNNAFYYRSALTSIILPRGLETIGTSAFEGCFGLNGISLPDGLKTIGYRAFLSCTGMTGNLLIPGSVEQIGELAFYNCTGLAGNLVIPGSVEQIGDQAFYNCYNLNGTLTLN